MQLTHRTWMGISAVVLIAIIATAAILVWQQKSSGKITAMAPLDPSCNLQEHPCQARFPDGSRITFSISPRPIQGLKPLQLHVTTEGMEARDIEVDFRGLGMNMGYNRPHLKPDSEGDYSGSGILSACILERMFWEATVLAHTNNGILAAPFRFETIK